jgi:hypothetical protein
MKAHVVKCRADGIEFAVEASQISSISAGQPHFAYAGSHRGSGDEKALWSEERALAVDSVEVLADAQELLAVSPILGRGSLALIAFLEWHGDLIPVVSVREMIQWRTARD